MIRKRDIAYIHSLNHFGCNMEEILQKGHANTKEISDRGRHCRLGYAIAQYTAL